MRFCTLGISLDEIINNEDLSTQMLTPIDLMQKGTIEYPIVADNKHIVGSIAVSIGDDEMSLSYHLYSERSEILKSSIRFFKDINDITPDTVKKRSRSTLFDQPFSKSEKFGDASTVLLCLMCDGIYDVKSNDNLPLVENMQLLNDTTDYKEYMENMHTLLLRIREI